MTTVLTNARCVLEDTIMHGTIVIDGRVITEIGEGVARTGEDVGGDYIIPGLIELHTDHLEQHYAPRPGVRWPLTAAIQAHDSQIAASGITTVFDCLRLGSDEEGGFERGEMRAMADAIKASQAEGRLRAEHRIHLRCEVSSADVMDHFAAFEDDESVGLVSLMDHTPGQRQFQTLDQYELYYKTKRGLSDEAFRAFVERRQMQAAIYSDRHRHALAAICGARGIALASHDDATLDHVEEAMSFNVSVAEFPTSMEAARASHEAGLGVLMGAPNVVRGKSHSGNIAARTLAEAGVLDVLSSDYVPFSLVYAPFLLADQVERIALPEAVAMVTANPARQVGLNDRGALRPGLRADLVRVGRQEGVPVVRQVWREGQRVA
ncbi:MULTISPECIES: alpha-D-ribose 1-methylphosphonate 5-triphosphate diphosphatase [unclassified Roseitalea]|uniref:alpha-D-ribose 1-methylphosphonate 5-triphosphate diphosphatase n=1 Tax=unclassified Roseitalea TaxID=2639107 RepID=UPI00273E5D0A|nr:MULTISPECIES: alpha-D-ribose 1-methylphosphonate 5-triphosphate diphosphatase [unclassified Roseitalea]